MSVSGVVSAFFVLGLALYVAGQSFGVVLQSAGAVILSVSGVALMLQRSKWSGLRRSERALILMIILWMLFGIVRLAISVGGIPPASTAIRILYFLIPIAFVFGFANSRKRLIDPSLDTTVHRVLAFIMVGVGIEATYSFFTHLLDGKGLQGLDGSTIYYGYSLLPLLVLFGEMLIGKIPGYQERNRFLGISVAILYSLILLSSCRMAIIAGTLYLVLRMGIYFLDRGEWKKVIVACGVLCSVFAAGYFSNRTIRAKIDQLVFQPTTFKSYVARVHFFKQNFETFKENPLFGTGRELNGLKGGTPENPYFKGGVHYAHNFVIQSLADSGLIGTMLLLGVWICFAWAYPVLIPLLLVYGFAGMADTILIRGRLLHPLFYGVALFLVSMAFSEARSRRTSQ